MSDPVKFETHKPGLLVSIRNRFFTGVIIAAPIGLTVWLITWFVGVVDRRVLSLIPPELNPNTRLSEILGFGIPGVGIIIAVVALWLLGVLASNFVGNAVLGLGERLLNRVPLVSNIYNALKQIVTTMAAQKDRAFKDVCLIEYPRKGLWQSALLRPIYAALRLRFYRMDMSVYLSRQRPIRRQDFCFLSKKKM